MAEVKKNDKAKNSGGCLVGVLKLSVIALALAIATVMIFVFSYDAGADGKAPQISDTAIYFLLLPKISLAMRAEPEDIDILVLSSDNVNSLLRMGLRGGELFAAPKSNGQKGKYDVTFRNGEFDFYYSHPVWAGHVWLCFSGTAKAEIQEHQLKISVEKAKLGKIPVSLKWAERHLNELLAQKLMENRIATDVLAIFKQASVNEAGEITAVYYPARSRKFLQYLDIFKKK